MPTVHVPNEQNTEPADPAHPTLPCTRHSGMVTRPLLDQKGQGQPQEWWSLDDVHPWPMSCPGPSWQGEPGQAPPGPHRSLTTLLPSEQYNRAGLCLGGGIVGGLFLY